MKKAQFHDESKKKGKNLLFFFAEMSFSLANRSSLEADALPPPKRGKCIAQDQEKKPRLVQLGRLLYDGLLPVPDVCNLVKEYANEFDGIQLWTCSDSRTLIAIMAVLDDGSLVSTSREKVLVWDVDKGVPHTELLGHTADVTALVVLPEHKVASGSADCTVRVWDVSTSLCIFVLEGHESQVFTLTLLEDGTLASSSYWWLHVWDPNTGARVKHIHLESSAAQSIVSLGFGHDMMAIGNLTGSVTLINVNTGARMYCMDGHASSNTSLCVLPDKRLVSAYRNGEVRLWNQYLSVMFFRLTFLSGHHSGVHAMVPLLDGTLITGSKDCTIRVWNTHTAMCTRTLSGHAEEILALILLPDGRLASSGRDFTIKVWDLERGECVRTIKTHSLIIQLAVLPGCKLAGSSQGENTVYVWG